MSQCSRCSELGDARQTTGLVCVMKCLLFFYLEIWNISWRLHCSRPPGSYTTYIAAPILPYLAVQKPLNFRNNPNKLLHQPCFLLHHLTGSTGAACAVEHECGSFRVSHAEICSPGEMSTVGGHRRFYEPARSEATITSSEGYILPN